MTRYIDADALLERMKRTPRYFDIKHDIEQMPTADVVPREEVDKLIYKLECLLCHATFGRLSKHTYDLRTMETVVTDCMNETYNEAVAYGYKNCAAEIFEEIEPLIEHTAFADCWSEGGFKSDVAALKKKYTEGNEYES